MLGDLVYCTLIVPCISCGHNILTRFNHGQGFSGGLLDLRDPGGSPHCDFRLFGHSGLAGQTDVLLDERFLRWPRLPRPSQDRIVQRLAGPGLVSPGPPLL